MELFNSTGGPPHHLYGHICPLVLSAIFVAMGSHQNRMTCRLVLFFYCRYSGRDRISAGIIIRASVLFPVLTAQPIKVKRLTWPRMSARYGGVGLCPPRYSPSPPPCLAARQCSVTSTGGWPDDHRGNTSGIGWICGELYRLALADNGNHIGMG